MMNMSKKEYNRYVARLSGTSPTGKNLLNAFWVGGLICALGRKKIPRCWKDSIVR